MTWDFEGGGYCCPECGTPFTGLGSDHVTELLDWQVIVRVAAHCRRRYRRACGCRVPAAVTAPGPGPPKAIGKGLFSNGFIAMLLTERFVAGRGMNSLVTGLSRQGAEISPATCALLILLRPHLHQAYLDAEHRRRPAPNLTPRHWELLCLVAAGHTNAQIARRLDVTEKTVDKHLENIYTRLQVSSRTAAVTRAFPDGATQTATAPRQMPTDLCRHTECPDQASLHNDPRSANSRP